MDIDKMIPHDLSVAVAEMVMGWTDITAKHSLHNTRGTAPSGMRRYNQRVPGYATDIRRAWEVVEHMIETYGIKAHNGFMVGRQDAGDDHVPDSLWYCEFYNPSEQCAGGDTAPEAICKAAIKAVTDDE